MSNPENYGIGGALPHKFWIKEKKEFAEKTGFYPPVKCSDQRDFEHYKESEIIRLRNTGKVDKNAESIYEGDIVRAIGGLGQDDSSGNFIVRLSDDLQWVLSGAMHLRFGLPVTWGGWESLEVIGCVFDAENIKIGQYE